MHGQKEAGTAGYPALAVRRDAAARHNAMHMGMMQQILPPRMQDCDEADFGTQVLRIGGDREHGFGAGAKQQIVERPLVLQGERGDEFGKREDDMEILHP